MSTHLLALTALLAFSGASACVAEDDHSILPTNPGEDVLSDEQPTRAFAPAVLPAAPQGCELAIATEGACASACSPDLVEQFVPEGTCAIFACDLTTGQTIQVGGCNT